MPVTRYKPVLQNPFPEITEVAVLPFINKTDNSNVDGREVAAIYAAELQKIPGFNVLSVRAVEEKMVELGLKTLASAEDARLLARALGVDAIVVGRVNVYDCFYPPQLGLTVDWYATNQYLHPIPPGYGLPWGTTREEEIPASVLYEAERALAKAQLASQTPDDPEGEKNYQEYLKAWEQEKIRQARLAMGIADRQDQPEDEKETLDPDDPDYEEIDPEEEKYLRMQQSSVDQQFSYAHGGRATLPASTHNLNRNSRNAEEIKRRIAEILNETETDEVGVPKKSPLPGGLETNEWIDRNPGKEVLQNQMHRTNKPEISMQAMPQQIITTNDMYPPSPLPQQRFMPQGYGIMIQAPLDPETGKPVSGGIFVEIGPDGNFSRAYRLDPFDGTIDAEISLEEIGLNPSSLRNSVPTLPNYYATMPGMPLPNGQIALEPTAFPGLPENWPDPRGFIPDGPRPEKPVRTTPSNAPFLSLTKLYDGKDSELTQALADFDFHFQDDKRVGGWQMTLNDKKAFLSFCCRMHIWEMFTLRGGAGKAIEVKRTWKTWYGGQRPY